MGVAGAKLRIRVEDADDLGVLSSLLQDAIVPVRDMAFIAEQGEFVMVANRFRWEVLQDGAAGPFERVNSGVRFGRVSSVKSRGLEKKKPDEVLELLAVKLEKDALYLLFAGGGDVRLEIDGLLAHVEDLGEPWPTTWHPQHNSDA